MKKRYDLIDTLRGLAIISMICFHACWIMNYFGILITAENLYGTIFNVWERSICIPFITIAGFSFSLGHNHLKSGLIVFGWGLIITAATCIFLYDIRIIFGVLTLIGSSILLTIPIDNALRNHNLLTQKVSVFLLSVSFLLFLLTYKINMGYLGFYPAFHVEIPRSIYKGYIATYFGFKDPGFYSTDYFSLFPWWFLYLPTGIRSTVRLFTVTNMILTTDFICILTLIPSQSFRGDPSRGRLRRYTVIYILRTGLLLKTLRDIF